MAPPRSTRAISSARRAKSADRIEGTISTIYGLVRFYHSGAKPSPGSRPGMRSHGLDRPAPAARRRPPPRSPRARASRWNRPAAAGREARRAHWSAGRVWRRCRSSRSAGVSRHLISGIAAERAGAGAGSVHQDAVEAGGEGQRAGAVQHHQRGVRGSSSCARRWRWRSQATARTPASSACAVLFPGAAQRSRKLWPGVEAQQRHDGLRADILHAAARRGVGRRARQGAARAMASAASAPNCRSQRASSHSGHESSISRSGHATGSRSTWRRTAFTKPAAERLRARFTSSTLSATAACAGMRSR